MGVHRDGPRPLAWRTKNVGRLLFASAERFVREKLSVLHGHGFALVTPGHVALLQNLDLDGTRLTELAARAQITKQGMLELVDRSTALGLVARHPDACDRRAKNIVFTPAGHAMLERLCMAVEATERQMTSETRPGFVAALNDALALYVGAASDAPDLQSLDPWRQRNAGRSLTAAAALFARDTMLALPAGPLPFLGPVRLALFRSLDLDGTRLTELARRAGMTKQAMLETVDKAALAGLVERRPDPKDGRAKMVVFTQGGLLVLDHVRDGVAAAERGLTARIGPAFMAELKRHLAVYASPIEAAIQAAA